MTKKNNIRQAIMAAAVQPKSSGGSARDEYSNSPTASKLPNWNKWKYMPRVEPWQACALALNIDPDSIQRHPQAWMVGGGDVFKQSSFPSDEVAKQFVDLLQLLEAYQFEKQHFKQNFAMGVLLTEFATWCAPVVRGLTSHDIPDELAKPAKDAPQSAPAATVKDVPATSPSGDDAEEQSPADVDHDKKLAALFNPVPVEALEKMFPAGGKWKSWAEKAASNGLKNARTERAKFNPYIAAVWFMGKGITGWDLAHCNRVLTNMAAFAVHKGDGKIFAVLLTSITGEKQLKYYGVSTPKEMPPPLYDWYMEQGGLGMKQPKPEQTAANNAITQLTEDEFNKQFRCPESFDNDPQRKQAVDETLKWYGTHNKNATLSSIVSFRMKLLEDHHCNVTLQNIRINNSAEQEQPVSEDNAASPSY